jgi:ABC-type branched-subunit amino acid transport system substrate-binding protein
MIAPLANSDEINLDYNYTFQMNPTFEVHGKRMAQHAVRQLGLDTLAVITPNDALGTASARSFRREAEKLGAYVSYYIEEDFSSFGYDLTDFTKVFTTDSVLVDSLNYIPTEAIYAPFTGQAANTLSSLLMTDLEVLNSDMIILGSEEWQSANLSAYQNRNFEIYYSQSFGEAADTTATRLFEEDFQTRFALEADLFAKLGYDIGNYLFESLSLAGNPSQLTHALRSKDPYNGLAIQIDMEGQRINQHIYIRPLTPKAVDRMSVN